jgi:hypothetical protein
LGSITFLEDSPQVFIEFLLGRGPHHSDVLVQEKALDKRRERAAEVKSVRGELLRIALDDQQMGAGWRGRFAFAVRLWREISARVSS